MKEAIVRNFGDGTFLLVQIGPSRTKDANPRFTVDISIFWTTTNTAVSAEVLHGVVGQNVFDAVSYLKPLESDLNVLQAMRQRLKLPKSDENPREEDLRVIDLPDSLAEVARTISFEIYLLPPALELDGIADIFLRYLVDVLCPDTDPSKVIEWLPEEMPYSPTIKRSA